MGQEHPLLLVGLIAGTAVVARWWLADLRAARAGITTNHALPGATPAPNRAIGIAVFGALVLLGLETWGESTLGLTAQQSRMTVLAGGYSVAAAFLEELIFRGYLLVPGRVRPLLLAGVVAASAGFALLHPFLWEWTDGRLRWQPSAKAWFSTGAIFVGSLWFYCVRLLPSNPRRSLLPCIAAHAAKNLGVFAIKGAQGFVSGWW